METIELSVEKARSKGDYQIASVELENWVAAGRQMLAERMSAGSHCAGPTGPSSAASSTVPAPARRQLSRGLSASALAMAPRLGRGKSSATPSIVEESAEDSPQAEVRLAAAQRMLQKAGHAGEAVLYICLVDKHNERGKVQPRALVLTGVAVYNCDLGCARLKRRIPLRSLGSLTVHEPPGHVALHVPSEYDYLLSVSQMGQDLAPQGLSPQRLSPCNALVGALQRAFQALHKGSGESLVVRTFSGGGELRDLLQRKQREKASGSERDLQAYSDMGSLGFHDDDDEGEEGEEEEEDDDDDDEPSPETLELRRSRGFSSGFKIGEPVI